MTKYKPFDLPATNTPEILLDSTGRPYAVIIKRFWKDGKAPDFYATENHVMDCYVEVIKLEPEGEDAVNQPKAAQLHGSDSPLRKVR